MWREPDLFGDVVPSSGTAPVSLAPVAALSPTALTCVYSGVWTQAIPDELIRDPALNASEVRIWCVLRTYLKSPTEPVSPSYDELCRAGNMARATLARGLKVLRLTRWLTSRVQRDAVGLMRGAIYILHDRRLDAGSVMMLDPRYPAFVAQCAIDASDDRVRKVAMLIAEQLPELYQVAAPSVPELIEAVALPSSVLELPASRTPAADQLLRPATEAQSSKIELPPSVTPAIEAAPRPGVDRPSSKTELRGSLPELRGSTSELPGSSVSELPARTRSGSGCISSSSSREKEKSTTTTARAHAWTEALQWSDSLQKHRQMAALYLDELSPDRRALAQDLLDELAGQLRAGKVLKPLPYLGGLVRKANAGSFLPTEHTLDARRRRQREAEIAEDHARFAADPVVRARS